jgi:WD40 repeat protein/tRNA A-37 threonylcarbamoyl transferase component Bud32
MSVRPDPDQVRALFDAAVALPADEQRRYLEEHCSDRALRQRVERLLAADAGVGGQGTVDEAATAPSSQWPSVPAPQVPGYENLEEIGRGGMGVVYKARQIRLDRVVALKMIRAAELAGPEARDRFQREAEAAARLQHPNIVQVFEVGAHEGRPFFSLEFVEGGSLAQKLAGTPLPAAAAARLVQALARAIHHAHERGVLHRDLKPSNVLLSAAGVPKITDFGLAKRLDVEGSATRTGAVLGTPSYMAPEQAEEEGRRLGPATDVWALGAILYECLTGRPPFGGATVLETLEQVRGHEPVPPARLNPRVPRDLETVCLKCLHKDPARRYGAAAELADDLGRVLEDRPVHARRATTRERAWRWCRRNPGLATASSLAAAGLVTVTLIAIVFALYQSEVAAERTRDAATVRQAKRDVEDALKKAEDALTKAELQSARLAWHKGLTLYEQGHVGQGMVLLARSLEVVPRLEVAFERDIRANLASWHHELRPLRAILEQPGQAFSPDGKMGVTAGRDGTARLWEVATGKPVGSPLRHQDLVVAVAFSPDGRLVLTASDDQTAQLWVAATGQPQGEPLRHQGRVNALAFSTDGKCVLTGSDDRTAQIWETDTGKPLGAPLQHPDHVGAVAFSPDGKTVLTGCNDCIARLWEAASGEPLSLPGHLGAVRAVAFSPDGGTIVTASADGTARLWEAATGKPVGKPLEHHSLVQAVAFSPDGRTVATGSTDRTVRLWETATGKPFGPPLPNKGVVRCVAFTQDGRWLLTGNDVDTRLWEAALEKTTDLVLSHQQWVAAVAFSRDGKILTGTGTGDLFTLKGEARLWDAATHKLLGPAIEHSLPVVTVAFSPDGKSFVTGSGHPLFGPGEARLWEVATRMPLGEPLKHGGAVLGVAFSPNGKTFLTGSRDKTAKLWEAATGKLLRAYPHPMEVSAVAFSPDGKTILTGCEDKSARLWDTETGKPLGRPLPHSGWVLAVAFSPDGKTLVTGGEDGTARQWETATGELLGRPLPHQGWVRAVTFSPDGKILLTGGADGTARLWEAATGKLLGAWFRHQNWVLAGAFSPDGRTFLTGSRDTTARLWEVPTPLHGSVERIVRWTQVLTGMEADPNGVIEVLDASTWQQRRQRLEELGGPP